MADVKLDIAFWNYDRTCALSDGNVRMKGVDAKYHSGSNVAEIFRGMVAEHRFDVAELGLTYFLRTFKQSESPFVAIPVFPVRAFRHSAIFVNASSGINKPEDLNGKTIGELALYSHDAGIVPKGMLMEEFGFQPSHLSHFSACRLHAPMPQSSQCERRSWSKRTLQRQSHCGT